MMNGDSSDYDELLKWLFVQFPSYQKVGGRAYKPGIGTMTAFDGLLGNPHRNFKTVHVAGTNGKGSVSHMIAAALASCGLKAGLYTSPHLVDFRERARIIEAGASSDGVCGSEPSFGLIPKDFVKDFLIRWRSFFESDKPSFFEITTALAFKWFESEKVDIAVIETGLGGRLDSTNVITPQLSIITNIGLEHCEHLGYTLGEIAGEKGGIIKPGVPVVVGESLPETAPVFERIAAERGSKLVFAHRRNADFLPVSKVDLDLKGDYQERNLTTVSVALSLLYETVPELFKGLNNDAVRLKMADGVCNTARFTGLRGRWETLRECDGSHARVICDTGHNAHGFRWVREQLDKISCDYDEIFFVFGVVADKDIDAIAHYLPHDVHYIFTNASSERSMPAAKLASILSEYGITGRIGGSVRDSFALADRDALPSDLIFIGGSNFVVCEAIGILE